MKKISKWFSDDWAVLNRRSILFVGGGLILLLFFCAGWQISSQSWEGTFYVYLDSPLNQDFRNIASTQKEITSVSLSKNEIKNPQKTIVHSAKIKKTKDIIQFSLGHPLLAEAGVMAFACQNYQTIDMVWTAGEVSFHGHAPKLSIKADCRFLADKPSLMGPWTIPKKQILSSPVKQKLFKNKKGSVLLFSHVHILWPKKWILSQVSFLDDNKEKVVIPFTSQKEEDYLTLNFY